MNSGTAWRVSTHRHTLIVIYSLLLIHRNNFLGFVAYNFFYYGNRAEEAYQPSQVLDFYLNFVASNRWSFIVLNQLCKFFFAFF